MNIQKLAESLPEDVAAKIRSIWEGGAGSSRKLGLCLAGAFSTGKTSLLNAMLGDNILPVALSESTTLPTFVSWAENESRNLVFESAVQPVSREECARLIVSPPEGARFFDLELPLHWLRGVEIIDLPGTGGTDAKRQAYGREAMRQADAVIYLLPPRGPGQSDLEDLRSLHMLGKTVFLAVSQWDTVEESIARGEKAPDLDAWRQRIKNETGIDCALVPVSKTGFGVKEIQAFIAGASANLANMRLTAFKSAACSILESEMENCKTEKETLEAESEAQIAAAHERLLAARENLLALRARAIDEQRAESDSVMGKWKSYADSQEQLLTQKLKNIAANCKNPVDMHAFLEDGGALLRKFTDEAAAYAQYLSEKYGKFTIAPEDMQSLQLTVLPPQKLDAKDFLDLARLEALRGRLEDLNQQRQASDSQEKERLALNAELDDARADIADLEAEYERMKSMPVPQIETEAEPGKGRIFGRMLGEVADLALLVLAPATIATKVGGMAGKTARVIGLSAKTARAVGSACGSAARCAAQMHRAGKGKAVLPPGIGEKITKLEYLTLGYWGERLGAMLDGESGNSLRVDVDALAENDAAIRATAERLRQQKLRLFDLEKQAKRHGSDKQLLEREKAAVQAEIAALEKDAQARKAEALREQDAEIESSLNYEKGKALTAWQRHYRLQLRPMRDLLAELMRGWWNDNLEAALGDKEKQVEFLLAGLRKLPDEKKQLQQLLRQREQLLQTALDELQCGK